LENGIRICLKIPWFNSAKRASRSRALSTKRDLYKDPATKEEGGKMEKKKLADFISKSHVFFIPPKEPHIPGLFPTVSATTALYTKKMWKKVMNSESELRFKIPRCVLLHKKRNVCSRALYALLPQKEPCIRVQNPNSSHNSLSCNSAQTPCMSIFTQISLSILGKLCADMEARKKSEGIGKFQSFQSFACSRTLLKKNPILRTVFEKIPGGQGRG